MTPHDTFQPDSSLSAEEATRQWWLQQYGTTMPEEMKAWMRSLLMRELHKARIKDYLLDDNTLAKVREGRRLCQTKLDNVEETLRRLSLQEERIGMFVAVNNEFNRLRQHLYEVNKRQASMLTEQRQLERFETFEAINGIFQRINTLENIVRQGRQRASELAMRTDEVRRTFDEAEKQLVVEQGKVADTIEGMASAALTMSEAQRLTTTIDNGRAQQAVYNDQLNHLRNALELLQKHLKEVTAEGEQEQAAINSLKLKRQSLEAHRLMIERGYAIQAALEELANARQLCDNLNSQLSEAIRQQNERNEQLGRLFTESQSLQADVKALQEESNGHRRSLAGLDSYELQRRALELRSRKLMLETGFSLWKNIAKGYDLIEQKEQLLTQLRLRADHLNRSIDDLENETHSLERQVEQKRYHWTLSKSQNVIELRGDLQEGLPCTVCGATHHPWQSETIGEQSALISSLKADCENYETELRVKQRQLQEWKSELTASQVRINSETEILLTLKERQKQDTDEWLNFSHLDRSFAECSPSTNREARTATMRQLIEKTTVDAETAEKELNSFTFHLNAISHIGSEIQNQQQLISDINIRLNEVNTACQVMAGQVERINQRLHAATQDYSRRYESLEHAISLPEWFRQWKSAPEALRLHIQDMMDQWAAINSSLNEHEVKVAVLAAQKDLLHHQVEQTILNIAAMDSRLNKAQELMSKAENALEKLLPGLDGASCFKNARQRMQLQQETTGKTEQLYLSRLRERLTLDAQISNLNESILQTETFAAEERRTLDIWMRQYNASNPPVQYSELQIMLADGKDWTDIRKQVREVVSEQAITQARIDYLRAQIIAFQAEGIRAVTENGEGEFAALRRQKEELEQQRRSILLQIAHYDEQLRAHQQTSEILTATKETT